MAILKRVNPKEIYISDRLRSKFEDIFMHSMTIVEAPAGYGKTTTLSYFLKKSDKKYMWFSVYNNDRNMFFEDFCAKIAGINKTVADEMLKIGYPTDDNTCTRIANAIMKLKFEEKMVLVLDNYNYIAEPYINNVIKDLSGKKDTNLIIIQIVQKITSNDTFEMITKRQVNCISKNDFELQENEIEEYYRLCGIKLDEKELNFLYRYTEGWISALYLMMLNFINTNSFEDTSAIEDLIYETVWGKLSFKEQDFLVGMSVFDSFSVRQAITMSGDILTEDKLFNLIDNNGFIRYESKDRKYYIHSLFKGFLQREFDKLEPLFIKNIYKKAGKWYADNDNHFEALKFYIKTGNYESVLALDWSNSNILRYVTRDNKDLFLEIVLKTPTNIKKKYAKCYLVFVLCLFILNERSYFKSESDLIMKYGESISDEIDREELLGEVNFLKSLEVFNDLEKMDKYYISAFNYMNSPTKMFRGYNLMTFDSPSILSMFHINEGNIERELELIEKVMPNYYILSEGNSKGIETLMKAEYLFEQGNLDDAYILCEKAKYKAESRKQIGVLIMVELLFAKIALMKAELDYVNESLKRISFLEKESKSFEYKELADMCKGMINIFLEKVDNVPNWLKDNVKIEENTTLVTLGYANIIYARYLLVKEEYKKLLAISGQMLDIASIFSNVMYKIYTYIYIALANHYIGKEDKAVYMADEAVKLAYKDNIIMPFVAFSSELSDILFKTRGIENDAYYDKFMTNLKERTKEYGKSLLIVKKAALSTQSYGLTKREVEVAKLAASRLSNKEIAENLFIAESTVKSNMKIIFSKLGIKSRSELKDYF